MTPKLSQKDGDKLHPPCPSPSQRASGTTRALLTFIAEWFWFGFGFFYFFIDIGQRAERWEAGRAAGAAAAHTMLEPQSDGGGSWFLFFFSFFFQRDFIKRKMNLNPGACSGGTTGPGPAGGRTPSPFQPRGCCSPEKTQRQGSRGRAPPWLPPQHVAIYRREGDTTLAPRELDEEEICYVHGGEEGTWPEHRAPTPARCLLPWGEQLWRLSALGGSLPSSPGDEGVGDPFQEATSHPPPCCWPGLLRAPRSPRAEAFTPAQPRFPGEGEGAVPSPSAAEGSLGTQSGGGQAGRE